MLCYAWDRLKEKDYVPVDQEEEKDISHLLTRVLIRSLASLIKRGFYREYRSIIEETATLRGKIQFQESINAFTFKRAKMVCEYDEMTHDILHNQIIKTTLHHLLHVEELDKELKAKVYAMYGSFDGISLVKLHTKQFTTMKLHRSNRHYGFVLDICKLLFESLLINEEQSTAQFSNFDRNHKAMANLFENFVRKFYQAETSYQHVKSEVIYWDAQGKDAAFLPRMNTDISLESSDEKIIMDTKYYHKTMSEHHETEKVLSGHLYQLFAYLSNNEQKNRDGKPTRGILLYPKVKKDLDLSFTLKDYPVKVCTVDLSRDWRVVQERLLEVVR